MFHEVERELHIGAISIMFGPGEFCINLDALTTTVRIAGQGC
jgi:hypothetical protein